MVAALSVVQRRALLGALLASPSATMGGVTVVLTRLIMPETDPFSLPMVRYGIGALILLGISLAVSGRPRIAARDWPAIVALAFLFYSAFPWAFASALQYTTAARGAIMYTTMPLIALTFGTLIGKETMT